MVQHRGSTKWSMLAQVIGRSCPFPILDAEGGEPLRPCIVFLAPVDRHLTVAPGGILTLDQSEQIHFLRPSLEKLLISAAENLGSRVIAVVLSGMGCDGKSGVQMADRLGRYLAPSSVCLPVSSFGDWSNSVRRLL